MTKYIIYWVITTIQIGICPDLNKIDKFGRFYNQNTTCSSLHLEGKKEQMHKEFDNINEAYIFRTELETESRNEIKNDFRTMLNGQISEIKIKEITN